MTLDAKIRLIAGSFILISLALAHWVSPWWLLFTAFVGVNLVQSSLTKWCLMEDILRATGIHRDPGCPRG
ncbi:MAG: DUF2892 domain-containing protein [Longimicrobiales bacterium]|nr:DUF2892 domain-containing protein [Longimicrobiales bacterium]